MGRTQREKPARLGEKLLQIRTALGLSQSEILRHLGLEGRLSRDDVSKYERGVREPSLIVLLEFAHAAGICLDYLVNDRLDLPKRLPCKSPQIH
jgi:transcriptional regulator with XRE-family HTH domain